MLCYVLIITHIIVHHIYYLFTYLTMQNIVIK